jgi:hypothetical protein
MQQMRWAIVCDAAVDTTIGIAEGGQDWVRTQEARGEKQESWEGGNRGRRVGHVL